MRYAHTYSRKQGTVNKTLKPLRAKSTQIGEMRGTERYVWSHKPLEVISMDPTERVRVRELFGR